MHLLAASGAQAADTSWTGSAGQPYWDLSSNWSAGAPAADDTRALLGAADTELRSGAFRAAEVRGTGRLTVSGGSLSGGNIEVQSLHLRGGELNVRQITVNGTTRLSGAVGFDYTKLDLRGDTYLEGGFDSGALGGMAVGANATVHDHTTRARSVTSWGDTTNHGRWVKTGAGSSGIETYSLAGFYNRGTIEVREGSLNFYSDANATWGNEGLFKVSQGASASVGTSRLAATYNSGRIEVDGRLSFNLFEKGLYSTGQVHVGKTGQLDISGAIYIEEQPGATLRGGLHNDGKVTLTSEIDDNWPGDEPVGTYTIGGPGLTGSGDLTIVNTKLVVAKLHNQGQLDAVGLAEVQVAGDALNTGKVSIDDAAELHAATYTQQGADAETRLDGRLTADKIVVEEGRFAVGPAWNPLKDAALIGDVSLGDDALLTLEVSEWGGLYVDGSLSLDGDVYVSFLSALGEGTHRVLEATGGLTGRFDHFASSLDGSSFRYTVTYGDSYVDVTVAAVPEPETYALMALGLAGVGFYSRRRKAGKA
ncbi:hypothetical protein AAW51_5233 [Caldimonas brevitalea]|uniref:Ice-binding protein C-terminal domain-containing protein n=1 Tax=Caldimonas brevitalea TaxID=413882 RepID=A0A0G3BR74_9BURK|nr:hypothetical protein AAW51_5233 [Caldimonas brevitalea]